MLCWRFQALYNIGSHLPFINFILHNRIWFTEKAIDSKLLTNDYKICHKIITHEIIFTKFYAEVNGLVTSESVIVQNMTFSAILEIKKSSIIRDRPISTKNVLLIDMKLLKLFAFHMEDVWNRPTFEVLESAIVPNDLCIWETHFRGRRVVGGQWWYHLKERWLFLIGCPLWLLRYL